MNTFEIKSANKKAFVPIMIIIGIAILVIGILLLPWIIRNDHGVAAILVVLVILVFAANFLRKILAKKFVLQISETLLDIRNEGRVIASAPVETIVMLKLRPTVNTNEFTIYTSAPQSELFRFEVMGQLEVIQSIITELQQYGEYVVNNRTSQMGGEWTEYVNKNAISRNVESYKTVNKVIKSKNKKTGLIIAAVVLFIFFLTLLPFFINREAFYEREGDRIFYGKKELVGVDIKEVEQLGYKVIKDSSHVYYKGEILEWADRATFELIREPFYMDKNGIYYETSNFFSKNKIVPLTGEYDAATFHQIANYYYKDKNNLYHLEINILDGRKEPLRKVIVPELDIATFETVDSYYWYRDKNKVYFSTWDELRPCNEIDRNTFVVLSLEVAKDKNHVYYLTRDLESEDKKATKRDDYAILEGAHAPSFYKIDDKTYMDENIEWKIRTKGEKEQSKEDVE